MIQIDNLDLFLFSNFCKFGPFFFDEKSFVYVKIIFFTLKFGEIFVNKRKTLYTTFESERRAQG
jgi:hypothetical protein